jgi:hypothetical protein
VENSTGHIFYLLNRESKSDPFSESGLTLDGKVVSTVHIKEEAPEKSIIDSSKDVEEVFCIKEICFALSMMHVGNFARNQSFRNATM